MRKARLIDEHGADCGFARLGETLIKDCRGLANWHDPCGA
jgi:hypothetical protein